MGWARGLELARRNRQRFDCATWLHKARQMPKEDFKQEVEKELTGKETEPWDIVYFKLYQSQMPVVEKAIEAAALMLGTDKSRGYCSGNDLCGLPGRRKPGPWGSGDNAVFDDQILQIPVRRAAAGISCWLRREGIMTPIGPNPPRLRLDPASYETLRQQVLRRDGWRCQLCGAMSNLEVHHQRFRSQAGPDSEENLITLCVSCYAEMHSQRRDVN